MVLVERENPLSSNEYCRAFERLALEEEKRFERDGIVLDGGIGLAWKPTTSCCGCINCCDNRICVNDRSKQDTGLTDMLLLQPP